VFISYRRLDTTPGMGRILRKELRARFGDESVFIDDDIPEGENWQAHLLGQIRESRVLVVLVGAHWARLGREKSPDQDMVRFELTAASQEGLVVIPILVDGTSMPSAGDLPTGLAALAEKDALEFRHSREDDDIRAIVARIDAIASAEPATPLAPPSPAPGRAPGLERRGPIPSPEHFLEVAGLLGRGKVVSCLGWDVNRADRDETLGHASGLLPDGSELAAALAAITRSAAGGSEDHGAGHLAEVAQHLALVDESDLYSTVRQLLDPNCTPTSVHEFFARLPQRLRGQGAQSPYQMIVTSGYDVALEQAFRSASEPYDVVIYLAKGENRGRFLWVPYEETPRLLTSANEHEFPIDPYTLVVGGGSENGRSVIVKVHGGVDTPTGPGGRENYVITENDYIDYLSRDRIESSVPTPILNKLTDSRILFLGYSLRDWTLRVFVQRVWGSRRGFKGESWAIGSGTDAFEQRFWGGLDKAVFFDYPVARYVAELDASL
jgi:hypothetical protein